MMVVQFAVNVEVLFDQGNGAVEGLRGFLGCESLEAAMPYAVVLRQIAIDRVQAVIGFLRNQVGFLAFRVAFAANDALVSQAGAHIVQRRSAWHDLIRTAFVFDEELRNA